ncbi:hypothetical protein EP1X_04625 [Thermococcus sp. EP1]|uniref:DUF4405 domain-containing protein n=1 Tax=Thermococcus sp. EP1 TaxID=1591054 RepID=UPI0006DA990D|nr:DUF4405 domain-containing protein [Thermococcus sp. EP1]KPU63078.1 hypothetical protein EP1X_04625 [Thermococcus sp. EP1]
MRWPRWVRPTIDVLLTIDFIVAALSGIALYFAPSGRIAEVTGWTFLGISRAIWDALHIYFGIAMIPLVGIHIVVNLAPLVNQVKAIIRDRKTKSINVKATLGLILVVMVLIGGAVAYTWSSIEGEEDTSEITYEDTSNTVSYDNTTIEITGTMLKSYTLEQIAQLYDVPVDELIRVLKEDYGIEAQANELLETIEIKNELDREVFKEILAEAIVKAKTSGNFG